MPRSFFGLQTSINPKATRNKTAGIFPARVRFAMLEGELFLQANIRTRFTDK